MVQITNLGNVFVICIGFRVRGGIVAIILLDLFSAVLVRRLLSAAPLQHCCCDETVHQWCVSPRQWLVCRRSESQRRGMRSAPYTSAMNSVGV